MIHKETVKKIKHELLLTKEDFKKLLDVSFATINSWEIGKYVPTRLVKGKIRLICEQNNIQMEALK